MPRHKQTAVARNRVKRRLRELSRRDLLPALSETAIDVVMRAMPSAYAATFEELGRDVARAAQRLGPAGVAS